MDANASTWNAGTLEDCAAITQERRIAIKAIEGFAGEASRAAQNDRNKQVELLLGAFGSGMGIALSGLAGLAGVLGQPGTIVSSSIFATLFAVCVGKAIACSSAGKQASDQSHSLRVVAETIKGGGHLDDAALEITYGTRESSALGSELAAKLISSRAASRERELSDLAKAAQSTAQPRT